MRFAGELVNRDTGNFCQQQRGNNDADNSQH